MTRVPKLGVDAESELKPKLKQINPSITPELNERIDKLVGIYRTDKMTVVNAALEYGAWNFKKAWKRYSQVREALYEDDDDKTAAAEAEAGNVVKITPTNAS